MWQREAYRVLRGLHAGGHVEYRRCLAEGDREGLAFLLHDQMKPGDLIELSNWKPHDVETVLGHVCSYAATAWNPAKAENRRIQRGAARHLFEEGMTFSERRGAAAAWVADR